MTGWERLLKTLGGRTGAEGHLEDAGRTLNTDCSNSGRRGTGRTARAVAKRE